MSVDLRVNRISAISGHMHRLEGRRMRRGASGTPPCACLPNDAYAQRWRLIRQTLIYLQPLHSITLPQVVLIHLPDPSNPDAVLSVCNWFAEWL